VSCLLLEMLGEIEVEFKDRLRQAIEESGMSVTELADQIGLTKQAVHKLLDGTSKTMNMYNLFTASHALQVNPEWLATGAGAARSGFMPLPVSGKVQAFALRVEKLPEEAQAALIRMVDTMQK
jgi:DNA-binding Xre family transcriptional regulator